MALLGKTGEFTEKTVSGQIETIYSSSIGERGH